MTKNYKKEQLNSCDVCKNGTSDYNGRIVCSLKYVYPSFQDYSTHFFDHIDLKNLENVTDFDFFDKRHKRYLLICLLLILICIIIL